MASVEIVKDYHKKYGNVVCWTLRYHTVSSKTYNMKSTTGGAIRLRYRARSDDMEPKRLGPNRLGYNRNCYF